MVDRVGELFFLDAFLCRIFKAKYFSKGNFLSKVEGSNPSFIWKSLLQARSLLHKGLRWRIGNGNAVRVWDKLWIIDDRYFYIEIPHIDALQNFTVLRLFKMDVVGIENFFLHFSFRLMCIISLKFLYVCLIRKINLYRILWSLKSIVSNLATILQFKPMTW